MKKNIFIILLFALGLMAACNKDSSSEQDFSPGGETTGVAGSMAKFSISNDHLFLINEQELIIFDLSTATNPVEVNRLKVDFGIETVFTMKERLFIGANNGVFIYDVGDPKNILFLSHYEHITSCDPVVATDGLAFATLNSRSACRWQMGANQLDVINIENIVNPKLMKSYWLQDPKGLAVDSMHLFVCDGEVGLKIFDYSNPFNLEEISGVAGIDAYDVILHNDILFLIGRTGLFQYDYSDIQHLELMSNILF